MKEYEGNMQIMLQKHGVVCVQLYKYFAVCMDYVRDIVCMNMLYVHDTYIHNMMHVR